MSGIASLQVRIAAAFFALLAGACTPAPDGGNPTPASTDTGAQQSTTRSFLIQSSADPEVTRQAGLAAEALLASYVDFLDAGPNLAAEPSFKLRIYASRKALQASNQTRSWAEAYYLDGISHAYLDLSQPNPHHWLIHEVVHQLNREMTGIAKEKWLNEGLATYFGSSRYADGRISPGVPDFDTYPLWWLGDWELSGDLATDAEAGKIVPLAALISGRGGPAIDTSVNAYYLGWWSLTHFLLHGAEGRHAAGYHRMLREGGSLQDFERHIGPVAQVEREWYAYLRQMVAAPTPRRQ
jgi:hypothetical protein